MSGKEAVTKIQAVVVAVVLVVAVVAGAVYYYMSIPTSVTITKTPIKIGFSMPLTGSIAGGGQMALLALKIWLEDVNSAGGILGRPVEFVYYDDHSNPSDLLPIYEKLITVDNVDFIIGSYGTGMNTALIPIAQKYNRTVLCLFASGANEKYEYPYAFICEPSGPRGYYDFDVAFFEAIKDLQPKPTRIAIVYIANEHGEFVTRYVAELAPKYGFEVIYRQSYPVTTTDFVSVLLPVKALDPDIVFIGSYPTDTVGLIKAAKEIDLKPKIFGGGMVGPQYGNIELTLGKYLNGIMVFHYWVPAPPLMFPGVAELLAKYQSRAPILGVDPLGYYLAPWAYAQMQILQQAIEATGSLDQKKVGDFIGTHKFNTVAGEIEFAPPMNEFKECKVLWIQFQGLEKGDLEEFKSAAHYVVLWPPQYKSGNLVYPFPGWS